MLDSRLLWGVVIGVVLAYAYMRWVAPKMAANSGG